MLNEAHPNAIISTIDCFSMDYAQAVSVKEEVIVWEINSVSSSDLVGVIVLTQNLNRF